MIDLCPPATAQRKPVAKPRLSGEPIVASAWWNGVERVQWETVRYSPLAQAANALHLKVEPDKEGWLTVWLSPSDLLLCVAFSQRKTQGDANGFIKLSKPSVPPKEYTFNAPLPEWNDEMIPLPEELG